MKLLKIVMSMIILIIVVSCARVPMKIDDHTLQKFVKIYQKQRTSINHPLLGVWKVSFVANKKINTPNDGCYAVGESVFVSIKRGPYIDFICTSYFGDFGGMSDQGPTHTVNYNGCTFWSFSTDTAVDCNTFVGKMSGILGSEGKVEATLLMNDQMLKIYEYPELAEGSTPEAPRIGTTATVIGGPLFPELKEKTIATIFLERRLQ